MAILNINSDASVVFANKLEKLSRTALPNAVRITLNSAAFDVKQKTMPENVAQTFESRKKNFFKATSRVDMAKGSNLSTMKSIVGFIGGDSNQAVDDLDKQERGGAIKGRTFIPMDQARIGGSHKKMVKVPNRLKNIRAIDRIQQKRDYHRVINRVGVGGHVIYKSTLFSIKSVSRGNVKLMPIFSYQKGREARIKATHFMSESSIKSAKKLDHFFSIEAQKQINKLLR